MPCLTLLIPVYNEVDNLAPLYERVCAVMADAGLTFELLFVNDGSTDGSLEQMRALVERDKRVRVVNLSRNFGQQAALSAGLKYVRGEAVVPLDADLQDPPEVIPRMVERWEAGYDVVYGIRTRRKEGAVKRLNYSLFYRLLSFFSDIPIPRDSGDFCLMDRRVVDCIVNDFPENLRFVRGLRAYAGFRQAGLSYERAARTLGKTKFNFRQLLGVAGDGIFGFSIKPLRLATWLGLVSASFSFIVGIFFILQRIFDFEVFGTKASDTTGFTALATGIFFMSGVILICLGILGEYLGRVYYEVKRRPNHVVSEVIEGD